MQAWLAYSNDGQLTGCKPGYERKPGHYYNWLGGVRSDYRGRGVATELLHCQHAWCRQSSYGHVRTHTYNRWRGILLLNLRQGFDSIGTVQAARGLLLVLEKGLGPAAPAELPAT